MGAIRLLERDDLLTQLREHASASRAGVGRMVLVAGEAGAGKTSLLERFRRDLPNGTQVMWGACEAMAAPEPLAPLLDFAHELVENPPEFVGRRVRRYRLFSDVLVTELLERPGSERRARAGGAVEDHAPLGPQLRLTSSRSHMLPKGARRAHRRNCLSRAGDLPMPARHAPIVGGVFSPAQRSRLLEELIRAAREDEEIVGAAQVGSLAKDEADDWSDIDLMLQLASGVDRDGVVARWTERFYDLHGAAHHLDVHSGGALYRVFLLDSTLQVDVSFWPHEEFSASSADFVQLFGAPIPLRERAAPSDAGTIGLAWLYALHSRSAIARGRVWQAITMLDELRDQIVVLACRRHGLRWYQGREADSLPEGVKAVLAATRASSLALDDLSASHAGLVALLAAEVEHRRREDEALGRLLEPLRLLARIER